MDPEEWRPETDPTGALRPPPRVPPTAVGLLTPPPPPHRRGRSRLRGASGTRLIALGMLGALLVAAGPAVAVAGESVLAALVGSGSVLLGGRLWWSLTHRRPVGALQG